MKKFIVPVLSVCFFISCSTDDTALTTVETTTTDSASDVKITKKSAAIVANPANAFDNVGKLYVDILDNYLENHETDATLIDVIANVQAIAGSNAGFAAISSGNTLNVNTVEWTVENIDHPETIINQSDLSPNGKQLLTVFVGMVDSFENVPYDNVNVTIKTFESGVMSDGSITGKDREAILSTCSAARHSIAYGDMKKRRWKTTRSGIVGSINGTDVAESVMMSVTTDLLSDNF